MNIHKHKLPLSFGSYKIDYEFVAVHLDVAIQDNDLVIWTECGEKVRHTQRYAVLPTGNEIPFDQSAICCHLGTVQKDGLVYHVYHLMERENVKNTVNIDA